MVKVVWTEKALAWLQAVHDYIAQDNPATAERIVQAIHDKAALLSRYPELGYRFERHPDKNLRILLYGHYRIAYLIKNEGQIDIVGVFHAALDMDRYMQ